MCKFKENVHSSNCPAYITFQTWLRVDYKKWKEEKDLKDEKKVKAKSDNIWAFDDDFDSEDAMGDMIPHGSDEKFVLCCCEKKMPHDENQKF